MPIDFSKRYSIGEHISKDYDKSAWMVFTWILEKPIHYCWMGVGEVQTIQLYSHLSTRAAIPKLLLSKLSFYLSWEVPTGMTIHTKWDWLTHQFLISSASTFIWFFTITESHSCSCTLGQPIPQQINLDISNHSIKMCHPPAVLNCSPS